MDVSLNQMGAKVRDRDVVVLDVLAELQGISQVCQSPDADPHQIRARLESASGWMSVSGGVQFGDELLGVARGVAAGRSAIPPAAASLAAGGLLLAARVEPVEGLKRE